MIMKMISIYILLFLFVFSSCQNEIPVGGEDTISGKQTFQLVQPEMPVVITRSYTETESIENVAVFSFDESGKYLTSYTESSSGNISSISIYLDKNKTQTLYVICNHPNYQALEERIKTEGDFEALKNENITIQQHDGAFSGKYVMTGFIKLEANTVWNKKIYLKRLAAHFDFAISFDPVNDNDDFKLTSVSVHQIPKGSKLLGFESDNSLETNIDDYVYSEELNTMKSRFFDSGYTLATQEQSPVGEARFTALAVFDMFENRRGQVEDIDINWPELTGMEDENFRYYKQLYKRVRAKDYPKHIGEIEKNAEVPEDAQFYFASYLLIEGVYQNSLGSTFQTKYYVYLGGDEYKDFNVCRNTYYKYDISIKSYDELDTRVSGQSLDGLTVFISDEILDSHCNVVRGLLYAPSKWEVYVKNPDKTPWLEVSHSSVYKPNLHGTEAKGDEAAFRINGSAGLSYFYVHTDDYIPNITDPDQNKDQDERVGIVVCKNIENGIEKEFTVKQLPARLVRLHIDYDIHLAKPIDEDFFVENKLEQKYMPYGFLHYWSFITDDLIAAGQWDGLANTRRLYQVATEGDKWGVEPAYPDGIPYDHALGYVLSKNRDRNGNGKIDPDEIMWYWAAANELQALVGHVYGGSDYYPSECAQTLEGLGFEEILSGNYHSSSPSVADPAGITPGSSYYVNMGNGKKWIGQRDRRYNVIAARRAGAWKGPDSGNAGGNVDEDGDDLEDEEVIMPK